MAHKAEVNYPYICTLEAMMILVIQVAFTDEYISDVGVGPADINTSTMIAKTGFAKEFAQVIKKVKLNCTNNQSG